MAQLIPAGGDQPPKEGSDVPIAIALGCGCISILALLVLIPILLPNFLHARDEAKYSRRVADEKELGQAVEAYKTDHGSYPAGLGSLVPRYVAAVPPVAGSNKSYTYHVPALRKSFGDYDISDDGTLFRTTFPNNLACETRYCYVIFTPALGVQVVPNPVSASTTSGSSAGTVSTGASGDGRATAYLLGDFSRAFDAAYSVKFQPMPTNRSWSLVSLYLIGQDVVGGSLGVEVVRGYPQAGVISGITSTAFRGQRQTYQYMSVACQQSCVIELRGTPDDVYAFIAGEQVGHWKRDQFAMLDPYVQLNGEVDAIGDRLFVRMVPIRVTANGITLYPDKCSHTDQGITAREGSTPVTLEFLGTRSDGAPSAYVSLINGEAGCRTAK